MAIVKYSLEEFVHDMSGLVDEQPDQERLFDKGSSYLERLINDPEAVPDEYCDESALVGPAQRIRDRYKEWESSGATGLILSSLQPEGMELMAELSGSRDRREA